MCTGRPPSYRPSVEPRSTAVMPADVMLTRAWWRDTRGSVSTRSQSRSRPIVSAVVPTRHGRSAVAAADDLEPHRRCGCPLGRLPARTAPVTSGARPTTMRPCRARVPHHCGSAAGIASRTNACTASHVVPAGASTAMSRSVPALVRTVRSVRIVRSVRMAGESRSGVRQVYARRDDVVDNRRRPHALVHSRQLVRSSVGRVDLTSSSSSTKGTIMSGFRVTPGQLESTRRDRRPGLR